MRQSILHRNGDTRALTSQQWGKLIGDGRYGAVIFDCDGTLVNSGKAHFEAFQAAVKAQGWHMGRAWYDARTGLDRNAILRAFALTVSKPFDVAQAVQISIDAFISGNASVTPIAETVQLARALDPAIKTAVVTNSEQNVAAASLCAIGMSAHFEHIVTVSDGLPPKPAPDLFLEAARRLDTSTFATLVFEDSAEGVQAASGAGMDVVQLID